MVAVPPLRMRPLKPYCDPGFLTLMLWSSCPKLWIEKVTVPCCTFSRLSVTLHSRSDTPTALPPAAPLQAGETSTNRQSAAASVVRPLMALVSARPPAATIPRSTYSALCSSGVGKTRFRDPAPAWHLGGRPLGDRAGVRLRGRHRPRIRHRRDRPGAPPAGARPCRPFGATRPRTRRDGVGIGRPVGGAAAPNRLSRAAGGDRHRQRPAGACLSDHPPAARARRRPRGACLSVHHPAAGPRGPSRRGLGAGKEAEPRPANGASRRSLQRPSR